MINRFQHACVLSVMALLGLCTVLASSCRPEPVVQVGGEQLRLAPIGIGQAMMTNGMMIIPGVPSNEIPLIVSAVARVPKIPRQIRAIRLEDKSNLNKVEVLLDGWIISLGKNQKSDWTISSADMVRQ